MRISSLEVAAIVAIGFTTVQLQAPETPSSARAWHAPVSRPDGRALDAVTHTLAVKPLRAREAVATN